MLLAPISRPQMRQTTRKKLKQIIQPSLIYLAELDLEEFRSVEMKTCLRMAVEEMPLGGRKKSVTYLHMWRGKHKSFYRVEVQNT